MVEDALQYAKSRTGRNERGKGFRDIQALLYAVSQIT